MEGHHHGKTEVAARSGDSKSGLVLRVLALILTLAASIVVVTNKQTKVVPLKVFDSLPPVNLPVSAKWHYLSAVLYFLVTNATSCGYAAVSLLLTAANRDGKSKHLRILIFVLDALMVALLFSGIGAASAVGVLGYHGNSHVQWKKVCNVFGKFCHQMVASIGLSLLGSVAFLFLVMLPLISSA
ncbi:CASP-like protein 1E2 [Arachis stenosperma]|uniref:CASP-like protein 1E2 n=1 Tax=Arachis stenosperma TaxID=217475 RepID=UPI0025AC2FBF|nr:CASP-like protein 1E2 [Arachis stenosperma]